MKIVALAGGIGGARFLRGLRAAAPDADITVIGNTGDDITLFGLRVCPDLDTVMYTLGGGINEEQGWGRAAETFTVKEELGAYGVPFPPSNPVVSIGTSLAVPGIRDAVAAKTVVGVSPIIGDAPVRGMADACLTAIGVETSARAVAEHYGLGLLDGWLVDETD